MLSSAAEPVANSPVSPNLNKPRYEPLPEIVIVFPSSSYAQVPGDEPSHGAIVVAQPSGSFPNAGSIQVWSPGVL